MIDLRNTSHPAARSAASQGRADRRATSYDCRTQTLPAPRASRARHNPRRPGCAALLGALAFVATTVAALAKAVA